MKIIFIPEQNLTQQTSSGLQWQPSTEMGSASLSMTTPSHTQMLDPRSHNKENEVEEMNSSDTSSSSSSDEWRNFFAFLFFREAVFWP